MTLFSMCEWVCVGVCVCARVRVCVCECCVSESRCVGAGMGGVCPKGVGFCFCLLTRCLFLEDDYDISWYKLSLMYLNE